MIELQKQDNTLDKCFVFAKQQKKLRSTNGSTYWFEISDDLLFRKFQCPKGVSGEIVSQVVIPKALFRKFQSPKGVSGEIVSQVVIPKALHSQVLKLAHCGLMDTKVVRKL